MRFTLKLFVTDRYEKSPLYYVVVINALSLTVTNLKFVKGHQLK